MKKFIFLTFSVLLFADDFKFNPQIDNLDDLTRFCWKSYSNKGINFGDDKIKNKELCDKYVNETIEYYQKQCNENNGKLCIHLAGIYGVGLGALQEDYDKATTLYEKGCDLNESLGCYMSALRYNHKFYETKNKKEAKKFKNLATKYYKKACKLGYKLSCGEEKRI